MLLTFKEKSRVVKFEGEIVILLSSVNSTVSHAKFYIKSHIIHPDVLRVCCPFLSSINHTHTQIIAVTVALLPN